MIAPYTDREFVNFFYGGLRFGLAEANATAAFGLMTKAAPDRDRDWSDRAGFATIVLTAEPVGIAARSIKRKIFSLSPTIFFNSGTYCRLRLRAFARMRAESQFTSKDEPSCSKDH
jgi:hypothetical protein